MVCVVRVLLCSIDQKYAAGFLWLLVRKHEYLVIAGADIAHQHLRVTITQSTICVRKYGL